MKENSTPRSLNLGGLVFSIAGQVSKCANDLRLVEAAIFKCNEDLIGSREVHDLQLLDVVIQVLREISPVLLEMAAIMESGKDYAKIDEVIQRIKLEHLRVELMDDGESKDQAKMMRIEIF